jgi:cell division protein FtsL
MKYYGNLALQPERAGESAQQQRGAVRRTRRRTLPVGEKLLYLLTVALLVAVAGVVIYRYAEIYQMNRTIQEYRLEHDKMMTQVKELQREVERLKDPSRIAEEASRQGFIRIDSRGIAVVTDSNRTDRVAMAMRP